MLGNIALVNKNGKHIYFEKNIRLNRLEGKRLIAQSVGSFTWLSKKCFQRPIKKKVKKNPPVAPIQGRGGSLTRQF